MIKLDFTTFNKYQSFSDFNESLKSFPEYLNNKSNYTGWYNLNNLLSDQRLKETKDLSDEISANCEVFLVIGIGGSFLGSKAVISALNNQLEHKQVEVIYTGLSLSSLDLQEVINYIKKKQVIINVISKSGNTLETLTTLEILLNEMKTKYNETELKKRVIVTTQVNDNNQLYKIAQDNQFLVLNEFDKIGGRFSIFTKGGLLPIAVSGIDIYELAKGAKEVKLNDAAYYASARTLMINNHQQIEAYTVYEPRLYFFTEWLKQLYGESLGKNKKGLLPINIVNTRDLHSMGQYIQDGPKTLFETVFVIHNNDKDFNTKHNKTLNEINHHAYQAVAQAHYNDDVNSLIFNIPKLDAYHLGYLLHFFMLSVTISGHLENNDEVFTQEGVEAYKQELNQRLMN